MKRIKIFLDPENETQSLVIKQEDRIPERRRATLVGIKTKIKELPFNVVTTKNAYRTEPEEELEEREELRNERAFDVPYH